MSCHATAVSIGNATLDAATFTDTVGTSDVTGTATINLGTGAALAFANSSAIDWTGGTLTITGTFVSGASLRFGTTSSGLTPAQLALISAPGFSAFALDANGYLTATAISFSTWITGTFAGGASVPADKRGPNDDADNDGEANLLEFATGQNPLTSTKVSTPLAINGANLEFTYTRANASIAGGMIFAVEWSDTLAAGSWSSAGVTEQIFSDNGTVQTVKATVPSGSGKRFVRLKVTAQ